MSYRMKVLCTSVGNDGFPAVLQALRQLQGLQVIGCDSDGFAAGLVLADVGFIIPARKNVDRLLLELKRIVVDEGVDMILPLSTEDQIFYAGHKDTIESFGVKVAISTLESVTSANNKHTLYRHCQRLGHPVPKFSIIEDKHQLVRSLKNYQRLRSVSVLKLAHGTGAQGVKIIDPNISADERFWLRDNIRVSSDEAIQWAQGEMFSPPVMLSDYLPGRHVSVDAFRTSAGAFFGVARTEERHLYGMGTVGRIVDEPAALGVAKALGEELGLTFCYNVEFKEDDNGVLKILEINPRFPASLGHTVEAGMNLPLMAVNEILGGVLSGVTPLEIKKIEYRRYWAGISI